MEIIFAFLTVLYIWTILPTIKAILASAFIVCIVFIAKKFSEEVPKILYWTMNALLLILSCIFIYLCSKYLDMDIHKLLEWCSNFVKENPL